MLSFIRTSLLIGAVSLLSACATHMPTLISFRTVLSPSLEVPPVTSSGLGVLNAELDTRTNVLSWTVKYSDLTGPVISAHFHGPALPGQNAGIAAPLTGDLSSPITGSAVLTPAERADLLAGKWYINLHTAEHPDGEIRGQVRRR